MQSNLYLLCNNFFCDAQFPFYEGFTNAQNNCHASLQSSSGSLANGFIGFTEVLSSFGVTNDNILYAHFCQHICRNFASECTLFFKVYVFCTNFNVCAFCQPQSGFQIGERYADNHTTGLVCCDWLQCFNQFRSFLAVLVHFPVAGNNCLSQCLIHN